MKKQNSKVSLLTITLGVIIILIAILWMRGCTNSNRKESSQVSLINALQDSVKYYINKDSESVATISILENDSYNDVLALQTKDVSIQVLQSTIKDYSSQLAEGSSVTVANLATMVNSIQPTVIKKTDTIIIKDTDYVLKEIYPTYQDSIKNKWLDYKVVIDKDTARLKLIVSNTFKAIVGKKKGKAFVDIVLDNPYSEVKTLRAYQITLPREKRWSLGPSLGATYYNNKVQPYIGVGISYGLIKF